MLKWGRAGVLAASIVVLWLSFAIRVWDLNSESIWHDEGWSIRAIQDPINTPDDNTPYVYYSAMHILWQTGIGNSPFAFRFGSVLIGMLTVAATLRVTQRWFSPVGMLASGVLVAMSPLLWEYAQEVRAYVVVPLIAALLLGFGTQLLTFGNSQTIPRWLWIAIFATEIIGLYTHNLVVPLVAWLSVTVGVVWLMRQDWPRILRWGMLHIGLLVLYVPWLLTQSPSGTNLNTAPEPSFELMQDIWYSYFLPVLQQVQVTDNHLLLNILAVVTMAAAIAMISIRRSVLTWVLTSHALLVPIFSTVLLIAASIDFHPRYYIAAVPGTFMLLVGGVDALTTMARPSDILRIGAFGLLVLLVGVASWQSLQDIRDTRTYQHDDFDGIAQYYATLPADAVIIMPFDEEPALQHYFATEYDIQADFINIPLYSDELTALAAIAELVTDTPRHVEFLTWFQLPADVRGMYPCLLGASSDAIGETRTFFGLSTQAFTLTHTPDFSQLASNQAYEPAVLNDLAYATGAGGVCVRSEWDMTQRIDTLSTTMQLLAPNTNWTIARSDAVVRDVEQLATPDADNIAASYHWLELPPASPMQAYPVAMTLYTPTLPEGYDVIINDQVVGKNFYPDVSLVAEGLPFVENVPL